MLKSFLQWFQAPRFHEDENKTRSALLLNVVLNTFLVALPVIMIGALLSINVPRFDRNITIVALAWMTIFGTKFVMHSGRVASAGVLTVVIIFVATTLAVYNIGTIRAPATSFYLLTIVLAGLVIGRRAIIWTASFGSIAIITFLLAEKNGFLPPPTLTVTATQGITFTVVFVIIGILLYLAVKSIDEAMRHAQQELANREQTEAELRIALKREQHLNEVTRTISGRLDLDTILSTVVQLTAGLVEADSGTMSLVSPDGQTISHHNIYNLPEGLELEKPVAKGNGLSWHVIETQKSVLLSDYTEHPNALSNWKATGLRSLIEVPLIVGNHCLGTLSVAKYDPDLHFNERDLALVESIGRQTAIAIQNARLFEEQQRELAERIRVEREREELIRKLEDQNDELTRFTYTVSHELMNPVVTIKGFLGSVERDIHNGNYENAQKDFQRISNATDNLHSTLSDLLELSRVGRIVNPFEEFSLADLLQDAMANVDERIRVRKVEVEVTSNLPYIFGDRMRLREVFENLLDNAAKYMGDQKSPTVEIGMRDGKNPVFFVRDNGMGIEPQYYARIFGLFEKLDPTSEGTGVGLALIKRIIETHGGKIWVESDGLGKGSTFCFTIPDGRNANE